jgi:hypothetical protein
METLASSLPCCWLQISGLVKVVGDVRDMDGVVCGMSQGRRRGGRNRGVGLADSDVT